MTEASTGLRKALARAGTSVIAIAEMQPADILAELSDEQKAALSASLAPPASATASPAAAMPEKKEGCEDEDEDGDQAEDKDKPGKKPMASAEPEDRVKVVAAAVATDAACKGKAALALSMLADDDYAGLSGAAMVKLIGKAPVETAAAADPEDAARADLRRNLAAEQAASTADQGGDGQLHAEDNHGWSAIHSDLRQRRS